MDPEQIRTAKRNLEQEAGATLAKLIKEFEDQTGMSVQNVAVHIDTLGSTGRGLQRQYEPLGACPSNQIFLDGGIVS